MVQTEWIITSSSKILILNHKKDFNPICTKVKLSDYINTKDFKFRFRFLNPRNLYAEGVISLFFSPEMKGMCEKHQKMPNLVMVLMNILDEL